MSSDSLAHNGYHDRVTQRQVDEWREYQRHVNALERQYAQEMRAYAEGTGPAPAEASMREILACRKESDRLLRAAMQDIDRRMSEAERLVNGRGKTPLG